MRETEKYVYEATVPGAAAADVLARLTAEAPAGRLRLGDEDIPLADWTGLKISLKKRGDSCLVKVRLRRPAQAGVMVGTDVLPGDAGDRQLAAGGQTRYKDLKKRMKRSFKAVEAAIAAGRAPEPETVAAFLADCRRMTTYSGKGDPDYPVFLAAVDHLEAAAARADLPAMALAVTELRQSKKECHSRYA